MRDYEIYAVDFDGTLTLNQNHEPELSYPNIDLISFLLYRQSQGDKIILNTCRADAPTAGNGRLLSDAIRYCENYGLHFDAVNDNLPDVVEQWGVNSRKIVADYYIDDKSRRENFADNWNAQLTDKVSKTQAEYFSRLMVISSFNILKEIPILTFNDMEWVAMRIYGSMFTHPYLNGRSIYFDWKSRRYLFHDGYDVDAWSYQYLGKHFSEYRSIEPLHTGWIVDQNRFTMDRETVEIFLREFPFIKVSHRNFGDDEYIYQRRRNLYDESGYLFEDWFSEGRGAHNGFRMRTGGTWETGWFIKKDYRVEEKKDGKNN